MSCENSKILEEFIILLLVPPTPFVNSSIDQVSFTIDTLLATSTEDEGSDAKHSIACVLACQNHAIAIKIFESKK